MAYRKRLGGYANSDQLYEVYGLKPEVVVQLKMRCSLITLPKIEKISLQGASLDDLARLPYLTYNDARQLVAFRPKKGILRWQDLRKPLEFDSLKIEAEKINDFHAPFVKLSQVKIGMKHLKNIDLPNGCIFIIGEIELAYINNDSLNKIGQIDLESYKAIGIGFLCGNREN